MSPSWSRHWPTIRSSDACAPRHSIKAIKGDLLDGFSLDEASFEDWRLVERERLRERTLDGLAWLLREQLHAARPEPAIQTALRLLSMPPFGPAARAGQSQVCVASLERDLAAEPEEATHELYRQITRINTCSNSTKSPVAHEDFDQIAFDPGGDRVHQFHDFDDPHGTVRGDSGARWRRRGRRRAWGRRRRCRASARESRAGSDRWLAARLPPELRPWLAPAVRSAARSATRNRGTSLHDLFLATYLPKATLTRLIVTLEKRGMVWQRLADGAYMASHTLRPRAPQLSDKNYLVEVASPVMERLCRKVNWPSVLAVPRLDCMEVIETNRPKSYFSNVPVGREDKKFKRPFSARGWTGSGT